MTVWKEADRTAWRYEFHYKGRRYRGNTGQLTREDAEEFEEKEKRRVRRAAAGLEVLPEHTPTIQHWAEKYLAYLEERGKVTRLDHVETILRVVLRFWGKRPSGKNPKNPIVGGEPYHDYRLADPIRDPQLIEDFEEWIRQRRVGKSGRAVGKQSRLHYMSMMSRMYRVAMLPKFVKLTGVKSNPFLTVERDRPPARDVAVTTDELRAWLSAAPKHTQLAIAIAALAPKLRLENVLSLRWDRNFDGNLEDLASPVYIRVEKHKTATITKKPLVSPVSPTLRAILRAAQSESTSAHVVTYRGKRVKSIRAGVKRSAEDAGLLYGRDVMGGVTFHTIRHTAATLLAELPGLTEAQRAAVMGQNIQTTQRYTHLRPVTQAPTLAALGSELRLDQILAGAFAPTENPPGALASTPPGSL